MIVLASEDVGNADPQALQVAVAAAQAVEHVGMPEASTRSPSARSTVVGTEVQRRVRGDRGGAPSTSAATAPSCRPRAARGGVSGPAALGRGQRYEYPHDRPGHSRRQELMPARLVGERFYAPDEAEAELLDDWKRSAGCVQAVATVAESLLGRTTVRLSWNRSIHAALVRPSPRRRPACPPAPALHRRPPSRGGSVRPRGLPLDEMGARRLLRFDPRHRYVVCALAWVDGSDVLVGLATAEPAAGSSWPTRSPRRASATSCGGPWPSRHPARA
jgi:hypothetical protein